jgi:hypothetical protein
MSKKTAVEFYQMEQQLNVHNIQDFIQKVFNNEIVPIQR